MLVTAFEVDEDAHNVLVRLVRNDRDLVAAAAEVARERTFTDRHVRLTRLCVAGHEHRTVGWELRYRHRAAPEYSTLIHPWYFGVFYRRPRTMFPQGRPVTTLYRDDHIVLLHYGDEYPDYMLIGRNPPARDRKSDVRFTTIPEPHPIESE